jgi:hypothetical protein
MHKLRYMLGPEQFSPVDGCPGVFVRIHETIQKCVVFFGMPDSRPGRGGIACLGTGFLVNHENCGHLITAKHIAHVLGDDPYLVRVNTKDGKSLNLHVDGARWVEHPDPSVDVALSGVSLPDADVTYVPSSILLASDAEPTPVTVGVGDTTYTIGLWRLLSGEKRNLPVVHRGSIALIPREEKIPVRDWLDNSKVLQVEGYLIETQGMTGLSGSPVFFRPTVFFDRPLTPGIDGTPHSRVGAPSQDVFVLGLWSGSWDAPPDDVLAVQAGRENRVSVGMGVVVPAGKIIELLNQERVVKRRKELLAIAMKERAATFDSAVSPVAQRDNRDVNAPPASDANPTHREDFTRLVGAAARKREPEG